MENPEPAINPLSKHDLLLLGTKELVGAYWPYIEDMITNCIRTATFGEITSNDILQAALDNRIFLFVAKTDTEDGPDVKMVMGLEPKFYPEMKLFNVAVLFGSDLGYFYKRFWKHIVGWAYINGARAMDAEVMHPRMERLLRRIGFEKVYTHVRQLI